MKELEVIIYEKRDHVAWVTLNRPEVLNARNEQLREELLQALKQAAADEDVYVIVITGTGNKAFCAGADIREFEKLTPTEWLRRRYGAESDLVYIRKIPKPVIAMVNGYALGGGFELAMACDVVIASDNARFGHREVGVGIIPGGGGTQLLPRLIGEKKTKELIFTGMDISAEEALQLGLVNKVVPKEKLREAVEQFIAILLKQSPLILGLAKLAINRSFETAFSVGLACEIDLFSLCLGTEDQKEGVHAFLEKRQPSYKGR